VDVNANVHYLNGVANVFIKGEIVRSCNEKLAWYEIGIAKWFELWHNLICMCCLYMVVIAGDLELLHDMLVWGVVRIDLSQVLDLGSYLSLVCSCAGVSLRQNVVDDGLELGSRRNWGFRTEFREELRSYRSWMSCEMFGELENWVACCMVNLVWSSDD